MDIFNSKQCFVSKFIWVIDEPIEVNISEIAYVGSTYQYIMNTTLSFNMLNVTQNSNRLHRIAIPGAGGTSEYYENGTIIKKVVGYNFI